MEQREEKGQEDKTEEATEEKRNQFREEGNIANPREIVACVTLILFTSYFYFSTSSLINSFQECFKRAWYGFPGFAVDYASLFKVVFYAINPILPHFLFIVFACAIFPTLIGLVVTRFNWSWNKMNFNLGKLNPISGFGRMFSFNALVEIIKVIVKCSIFTILIYFVLKGEIFSASENYFFNNIDYMKNIGNSISKLMLVMCAAGVVIGGGDFSYNFWKINRDMKMTKQELKEEVKKHEGDPLLKSQRKRMARDFIMRKSLKEVPKASFIVTNPEHFSIAIRYKKGMPAPVVVAKGQDLIAFKIREIAKQNDIMIVENKPLARTLYKTVKVGQEIPPSLYQSVIEVIKYIYKIRGKKYFERFEA
ncbi:EscU/YscU/HrcU family type III secretion system export apparatus switch protein [Fluviispira multicolorata]|uniref:Flagellar biosynthetic protein FlhB n=1 Tax=Fluviispira multicolorata TaxID=2654512 RepID=A0A833JAT1_9BACT|nr:EscU/YscU/HrcU family type III secretion system export apparatus switch protein [Fluviispira multicolorata]KAB8027725.1 flagellar type III secretion system protein FlhB [Fluviispira multicolorata]